MNTKIIFWINDDLSTLGLPKILQEKYNFDIYAVLDITDKQKKFFQKQQLIKFSKIWYFHDYISNTNTPNIEFLKHIEEKYKINLWLYAANERFFNHFNQFYKFSSDEILSILEQECKLFENVIDETKPDYLIMSMTTLHHNHLFYEICKARGIKLLILQRSFFVGKNIISSQMGILDNTQNSTNHNFGSLLELESFLEKHDATPQSRTDLIKYQNSNINYLKAALKYLFSNNSNTKTHYTYYGRSKFAVLKKMIIYTLKKRYREFFMNKNLIHDFENKKPFIYFPLHIEQERSLLIAAPFYTNQIEVIRNIVNSLPVGYDLYVKEHPTQILRGWRSISDYKQIMNLPNVKLIHPSIKSKDIIKKSSLVITIGGTAGLEAAFYNKPSIIFTDQDYSILPSVHKVTSFDELPNAIRASLKQEICISDLNNYINLIESNSFDIDIVNLTSTFDEYFHYSGFLVDIEIPIEKMKLYLEQFNTTFDKLATEIVKKIQKYKQPKSI